MSKLFHGEHIKCPSPLNCSLSKLNSMIQSNKKEKGNVHADFVEQQRLGRL
jgi:hypothetical protein